MTDYYGLAIGIEFGHTRWKLPHRDIGRIGKRRERHFLRFAHVQDKWPVAPIDPCLQLRRCDFSDRGHAPMITSGAAAALLDDSVRVEFYLREIRQHRRGDRKGEPIAAARKERIEMGCFVKETPHVFILA